LKIGIIGTGHLAANMVEGWMRDPENRPTITLSPRNARISAEIAARHGAQVADDNQAVLDVSDIVVLACRPAQSGAALDGLSWRAGQHLVSVCAGVPIAGLPAPGAAVSRAMPLTASRIGESPTILYPGSDAVRAALAPLGTVIAVADEAAFEIASVDAAVYGWAFALIGAMSDWSAEAGLEPAVARHLTAHVFRAATGMVLKHPGAPLPEMLEELATPGGITELGLAELSDRDALDAWKAAADKVLERLRGRH
jgi:pyrroline-5-carboxylate reductase